MKALITGATGFIGRNLCEHLQGRGIEYDTVGRDWQKTLTGAGNYDLVFYLAGEVRNPAKMYEANVRLLYRTLSVSLKWDCPVVYIGSSSEYGRMPRAMRETDPINPTNFYEATKGMGTLLCQGFAKEFGKATVIVRPSAVYGKYENKSKLIPTVIQKVKAGETVDIYPGAHDWIHVDDFISAVFTILLKGKLDGSIYNVSSGEQHANVEIAADIGKIMGAQVKINKHHGAFRAYDSDHWLVNNNKIKELGWKPKYNICTGLAKTVKEILELEGK
jgi:dTDP-glucose 4,6-dehydratase